MKRYIKLSSLFLSVIMIITCLFPSAAAFADETEGARVSAPLLSGYCSLISQPVICWSEISSAEKIVLYRSAKKNGEYKKLASVSADKTSYTDKKAKVHKTYYYKVLAVNSDGVKSEYSNIVKQKAKKTVFVGDSVMEGVKYYKALPKGKFIVKIGMGTYTFYNSNYFKVGRKKVTGIEKLISMKPDRVFIMLGMNETAYKNNKSIIQYYRYALEDLLDSRENVEIVILPVSPTKANSGKSIPKKKRIKSFNKALKKMTKEFSDDYNVKYYDYTSPFKDKNGNLKNKYDGGDGCHWKPSSTKMFIKQMKKYAKKNP